MPEYVRDSTYQELVSLAVSAGMKIEYVPFEALQGNGLGVVFGELSGDEYQTVIRMIGDDEHYPDRETATFTLAHEMAHALTRGFYSESADFIYPERYRIRQFIEADADKIGAALYRLAEDIAIRKAGANIQSAANPEGESISGI